MAHDPDKVRLQQNLDAAHLEIGRYKRHMWVTTALHVITISIAMWTMFRDDCHTHESLARHQQREAALRSALNTERATLTQTRRELDEERERTSQLWISIDADHRALAQLHFRWHETNHPVDPRAEARRQNSPYFEYIDTRTGHRLPLITEITEAQWSIHTSYIDDRPMRCRRIERTNYAIDSHFGLRVWLPDGTLCPQSTPLETPASQGR